MFLQTKPTNLNLRSKPSSDNLDLNNVALDDLEHELNSLISLVEQDIELAYLQQELLLLMQRYEFNAQTQELNRQVAAILAALLLYGSSTLSLLKASDPILLRTQAQVGLNKSGSVEWVQPLNMTTNTNPDILNKVISDEQELHTLFATPDSIGNKAICAAEGNCTSNGIHTANWYGHPDPGDGKLNKGFCSIAEGRGDNFAGGTPEQADQACVRYILKKVDSVFNDFKAAGVKPTLERLLSALDLFNQAAPIHSSLLPRELAQVEQQSLSEVEAIATARSKTFWVNGKFKATGLLRACQARTNWSGSKWDCVYSDQLRRVKAMNVLLRRVVSAEPKLNKNESLSNNSSQPNLNKTNTQTKADLVVNKAMSWVFNPDGTRKYKHFKQGQTARCADFVRHVLKTVGITVPVSNNPVDKAQQWNGPYGLRAQSFFGTDVGHLIKNEDDLRPGDLVAFANTYGNWPEGSITHVGIYVGRDDKGRHMMVDRSTSSKPIFYRPLSTFRFRVGVRPYAYE